MEDQNRDYVIFNKHAININSLEAYGCIEDRKAQNQGNAIVSKNFRNDWQQDPNGEKVTFGNSGM